MPSKKNNIITLLIILHLSLSITTLKGQNSTIDSLQKLILTSRNDTQKINLLNDLCWELQFYDNEKALQIADNALNLAKTINYYKGIADANVNLGNIFDEKGDYNSAIKFYKEALIIRIFLEDQKGIASLYNNIGTVYYHKGDYSAALENYKKSLQIRKNLNDQLEIASSFNNIGLIYEDQGDYLQALNYYIQAYKIYEKSGNQNLIAKSLNNIGNIYFSLKNYSKALESYLQSLNIYEKIGNKKGYSSCLRNIGNVYTYQNDYNKALEFFKKSLVTSNEIGDLTGSSIALANIGNCYYNIKNYNEALTYYKKSNEINTKLGNKYYTIILNHNIANCYLKMNMNEKALNYYKLSLEDAKSLGLKEQIMSNFEKLAELYAQTGNYQLAYEYHKKYFEIYDSLNNEENKKNLAKLQTLYETEKKQKEIELLNKDKELKEMHIKKQEEIVRTQSYFLYAIAGGFVAILFFSIALYKQFQQKKKANILLEKQKQEIEKQAIELAKLSIVARDTDNAVIIADSRGFIEWINEGYTRMFGYTLEELLTKFGPKIQDSSSNPYIINDISKCLAEKKSVMYISHAETKTGEKKWIQTTLTPITDSNGKVTKLIAIDSDITKIKEAEEQIAKQKHEIEQKNIILNRAYQIIEIKNKNITDSIKYAERIQKTLLPSEEKIKEILPENFIFYLPKDIVSGDFYWIEKKDNNIYFSVIDCTGHGVPGAFMSVMAYSILNQALNTLETPSPAEILNFMSENIYKILKNQNEENTKIGMDLVLCCYNPQELTLEFAGVHNPLYIVRNNTLLQFKSDPFPIGEPFRDDFKGYTNTQIKLAKNDMIYAFSDGYIDQFGGPKRKKFMSNRFRELLHKIHNLPLNEQKVILEKNFYEWKRDIEQYDDICIMGIRIK